RNLGPFSSRTKSNTITERLEAGQYLAVARRGSSGDLEVELSLSTGEGAVDPQVPGIVKNQIDDWKVGIDESGDKKRCFALTIAKSVAPEGWRVELPMMYFSVNPNTDRAFHLLDYAKFYDKSAKLKATVRRHGGGPPQSVPAVLEQEFIRS